MGTYNCNAEDIVNEFEEFLINCEGDVSAEVIAEAWEILAKKEKWNDRLFACNKKDFNKLKKHIK